MRQPYVVNKPGPLTQVGPRVWTVDDTLPGPRPIPRKMTVLVRDDGLLFFNGVPVDDAALAQLRTLGTPKYLVVPNEFHAVEVVPFAEKLGLTTYAHPTVMKALGPRLPAAQPLSALPSEAHTRLFTVEGFRTHETAVFFDGTLVVADLLTNLAHQPGIGGFMMRLIGFTGPEVKLPRPVRKRVEENPELVRSLLRELAELPELTRLVPSHGAVFSGDVRAALRRVADGL